MFGLHASSVMSDSATPRSVALKTPLSMGFLRQEYWSGLPFPPPGYLPNLGVKPMSPGLAGRLFSHGAGMFIAPLFKGFLLFLSRGLCFPGTPSVICTPDRKKSESEGRVVLLWSSTSLRTAGRWPCHLIWLSHQGRESLENVLLYLVHCNSKQRKDSLKKKGRIVNMWIKKQYLLYTPVI